MEAAVLATLSRLLDEALDRDPDEQRSWLESLGPEYDALKPRLRRLLTPPFSSAFLNTLPKLDVATQGMGASPEDWTARPGSTFGPYRLVRELAAGGMGSVWLAERTDGMVNRAVALKLPRGAWRRLGLAERMAREREILAGLEHPNIARLYDAGLGPDGQPFLALEFVDGRPIDEYCRQEALDVDARLRLFTQVVSAVAHAHSRLVVHRDLKPSNILVTPDGGVRLLDFGIAKILEAGQDRDSALTELAGRALTPDYASPEQITGAPIGTASDVYSLGVVLYELLTGVRPYTLKRESRGALEDAILTADPTPPSRVVPDRGLSRRLRGDLDWIVARAMAKEPDARYASAAALGADIERHLRHEPVEAAAPGTAYRMSRFARRHRAGLAAAALVVISLVAGIIGTSLGLLRARSAEAEAQAAAAAARADAATADRVTRFMLGLFNVTTPEESDGRQVTAREMLDRGAARVRQELAGEPRVQARMLQALGNAYSALGLYPEARPLLEDAVSAARTLGEDSEHELTQALLALARLQRRLDDEAGAEASVREALAVRERVYGPDSVEATPLLAELALILRTRDPEEALRLYQRNHDTLVALNGPNDGDAGLALANIGALHTRARRYEEARDALTRALAMVRAGHGENDPRVAGIIGNLAVAERGLGNHVRALEYQRQDLELSTRALGPEHPTIATIWLNLARSTQRTGDFRTALEQVDTALAILHKHVGPQHALAITAENSRAIYLQLLGRTDDARRGMERVLALAPDSNEGRIGHVVARLQLAELERLGGRPGRALSLAQEALENPVTGRDPKLLSDARWARACATAAQGDRTAAEEARQASLRAHEADARATAADRAYAQARYAACAGDAAGALALLQEAVAAGYSDPALLLDQAFAAPRELPAFAAIADTVRRRAAGEVVARR